MGDTFSFKTLIFSDSKFLIPSHIWFRSNEWRAFLIFFISTLVTVGTYAFLEGLIFFCSINWMSCIKLHVLYIKTCYVTKAEGVFLML